MAKKKTNIEGIAPARRSAEAASLRIDGRFAKRVVPAAKGFGAVRRRERRPDVRTAEMSA